jgi:hypothetical protein
MTKTHVQQTKPSDTRASSLLTADESLTGDSTLLATTFVLCTP